METPSVAFAGKAKLCSSLRVLASKATHSVDRQRDSDDRAHLF